MERETTLAKSLHDRFHIFIEVWRIPFRAVKESIWDHGLRVEYRGGILISAFIPSDNLRKNIS